MVFVKAFMAGMLFVTTLPCRSGDMSFAVVRGTLIAVAPTRDGIVMAADSRSTVGGKFCDDTYKLVEVEHPQPTAIAVAGIGIVFSKPPADVADLCAWIKTAPRVMDIEQSVKKYIEDYPASISEAGLVEIGNASLQDVRTLTKAHPDAPDAYAGNNLYTIVVARHDSQAKHSRIGVLGVRFNPNTRDPEITDHAFWNFYPDSMGQAYNFGLFDYVPQHVFKEGRQFVNEYARLRPHLRRVHDISPLEAIGALANLIQAASRTTEIVPSPVGIGGPTDILLLGDGDKPTRVRWK